MKKLLFSAYSLDVGGIETALVTAYKRNFDALENVRVEMDKQTGATHVYSVKEVMEKANDEATEISIKEAQKINPDYKEEDEVNIEIVPRNFGRIAAQTAKQVIIQKLREAEREIIYTEYNLSLIHISEPTRRS